MFYLVRWELEIVSGAAKVIDELGLMILSKDIELKLEEIKMLKKKIEVIEQYIQNV